MAGRGGEAEPLEALLPQPGQDGKVRICRLSLALPTADTLTWLRPRGQTAGLGDAALAFRLRLCGNSPWGQVGPMRMNHLSLESPPLLWAHSTCSAKGPADITMALVHACRRPAPG